MTLSPSRARSLVVVAAALLSPPALAAPPTPPTNLRIVGAGDPGPTPGYYTTNFDGTENPLSEGGVWSNSGGDWTYVQKSGGLAYGTQTGTGGYDDSYAVLSGFAPDHSAWGIVQIDPAIDRSCTHEVEILLRWADSAGIARGYECNISFDGGYAEIVRWNGPKGDFTPLASGYVAGGIKNGDVYKATVVGNVITIYLNDVELARATDATFATGNPGVGFFRRECGTTRDFAFTSYTATNN